jgi:prophage tail gpP-like protein
MPNDDVTMLLEGRRFFGWKEAHVRRSIESLCGTFSFALLDKWAIEQEAIVLHPGQHVELSVGDDVLIDGYIDRFEGSIAPQQRQLTITGRDKTADLVDCSPTGVPGSWKNIGLDRLALALASPYDIDTVVETDIGAKFPSFVLQTGETVYEALTRAAQKRAVMLVTDNEGRLVLTSSSTERTFDGLELGLNIKEASVSYDYSDRFSDYTVKGQSKTVGKGWTASTMSIVGEAFDDEIDRFRPRVLKATGSASKSDCQNQARWEANIRAAKSVSVRCTVQGVRQSNGDLWPTNRQTNVKIPDLGVQNSMLISTVEYAITGSGSVTSFELRRPDSYESKPAKTIKKIPNLGW